MPNYVLHNCPFLSPGEIWAPPNAWFFELAFISQRAPRSVYPFVQGWLTLVTTDIQTQATLQRYTGPHLTLSIAVRPSNFAKSNLQVCHLVVSGFSTRRWSGYRRTCSCPRRRMTSSSTWQRRSASRWPSVGSAAPPRRRPPPAWVTWPPSNCIRSSRWEESHCARPSVRRRGSRHQDYRCMTGNGLLSSASHSHCRRFSFQFQFISLTKARILALTCVHKNSNGTKLCLHDKNIQYKNSTLSQVKWPQIKSFIYI